MAITYLKQRSRLTENERLAVDALDAASIDLTVLAEDDSSFANIDLAIETVLWELKNVGDGKHSINDRLRDAYKKWRKLGLDESEARVIVSAFGGSRDEESIIDELRRRSSYFAGVIYIRRNGELVTIKE